MESIQTPGAPERGHRTVARFELDLLDLLPQLHGWARRRTGSVEAANDLLQDTVVRALWAHRGYRDGTNLRAWLFMIMRNLAADEARRRSRRGLHLSVDQLPLDQLQPELGVAALQDSQLGLRDLQRAFGRLAQAQQQLLLRVAAGGESYLELAAAYGVAEGTVKSRIARARADLRALLAAADEGRPGNSQFTDAEWKTSKLSDC